MEEIAFALDTFYAVMAGALVMFMAAGFTMLEAGLMVHTNCIIPLGQKKKMRKYLVAVQIKIGMVITSICM